MFSYLAGLEVIFHTMLEAFSFRLQRGHDETVPHKVSGVTDSFTGAETARESDRVTVMLVSYQSKKCFIKYTSLWALDTK